MEHRWDVSPSEAIAMQRELQGSVSLVTLTCEPRLIAGADVSFNRFSDVLFSGFIVLSYPELEVVDHAVVRDVATFPYVPGLLSFREIPSLQKAWDRLSTKPDLVVADGVGIAHPRRLGIASHLGVLLDVPTIGCAKSVLTGTYAEPAKDRGFTWLYGRNHEILGAALRTKPNVKPVFVSPGHRITIEDSLRIIQSCVRKHRIPEPTRLAHDLVNEYRRAG